MNVAALPGAAGAPLIAFRNSASGFDFGAPQSLDAVTCAFQRLIANAIWRRPSSSGGTGPRGSSSGAAR